jgi:hypothetical protein
MITSRWTLEKHRQYWRSLVESLSDDDLKFYLQVMRNAVQEFEVEIATRDKKGAN